VIQAWVLVAVNVKLIGSFRSVSGKNKLALSVQHTVSLREVVEEIVKKLPKLEPVLIDTARGSLKSNLLVLVNGKEIGVLSGWETPVKDGDEVVFVPVVHGG
jgi:MoaD family protein